MTLLRSVPGGGFEPVGRGHADHPGSREGAARRRSHGLHGRADDATLGKVTFQAVATIAAARDAHPADNTIIAPPMKIRR